MLTQFLPFASALTDNHEQAGEGSRQSHGIIIVARNGTQDHYICASANDNRTLFSS